MFCYHLENLPLEALGRECFELQLSQEPPNSLITEIQEHLQNLDFQNSRYLSKFQYQARVKSYIKNVNKNQLLEKMKGSKKIDYDECSKEEFKRKSYFYELNLKDIRMRYKASSNMLETFKVNFPRKYKNKPLTCDHCEKVKGPESEPKNAHENKTWDSQQHVLTA